MSLAVLFHILCAQHVLDINVSIVRSLRLFCWITTLVVCSWFDVCWCFGAVGLGWGGIRVAGWSGLLHRYHPNPTAKKLQHTLNQEHTTNVVIQQHNRKLLVMDILMSETCWARRKWNKISSDIKLVFYFQLLITCLYHTGCPTCYWTQHFFNNSNTNEDIATKFEQEYVRCVRNE